MKRPVYPFFLSLFLLTCCSCHAGDFQKKNESVRPAVGKQERRADAEVAEFLGSDMLHLMENAARIEVYRIARHHRPENTGQAIQGYPVISKGRDLGGKELKQIVRIIRSAASYEFQWSKRTRIRPDYALRFVGDNAQNGVQADIVIDFNSRQWAFSCRNLLREEDISKRAGLSLSRIIQAAFTE